MIDLNKVMIMGNLTRDPENRYTPNGQGVASFSVATNRRWKSADGQIKDSVEFHDVVAWGKLAEIAEKFLKRGRRVFLEGRLQTRSWEGQDGVKRNKTEIIASNIILLDRKPEDSVAGDPEISDQNESSDEPTEKEKNKNNESEEVDLDDIPF